MLVALTRSLLAATLALTFMPSYSQSLKHQSLDSIIKNAMRQTNTPVVGYAIIDHYKIVKAKTLSIDPSIKVNKNSLFQAASISKSVTAYAAAKLIANGKLSLDKPANAYLTAWKIPVNKYNQTHHVTLRQILSMTAGLSVSGFAGYRQDQPLPSLIQILNGQPPANNATIRVFYQPGSRYFYSGGGYQVLQLLIQDRVKTTFNDWMNHSVLKALGMHHSIYQYPLSQKYRQIAVPGFWGNGKMLFKGWNNYAIAGSGGLWSTPTDLAKFALNITQSYLGKKHAFIPQQLAKTMLTRQKNSDFGFGVIVNGKAKSLNFRKHGHNYGYHGQLIIFPNVGKGLVILTDSENGLSLINYIVPIVAHRYHWPCYFPYLDELMLIPEYACLQ